MVIRGAIAIVLVLLLGYAGVEAWPLLSGPALVVASPEYGASVPGGILSVEGTVYRAQSLSLNGAPLLFDETGSFSRLIVLPRGGAILTLTATDRFGRTITKQESVYVP